MTTTSLPDRLRALADFIDSHNLPDPHLAVQTESYGTAHLDTHEELCEWAEVLGAEITVNRFEQPERVYDYYGFTAQVGAQRLHFAYSQDVLAAEQVPA